jgi:hypothetical protein
MKGIAFEGTPTPSMSFYIHSFRDSNSQKYNSARPESSDILPSGDSWKRGGTERTKEDTQTEECIRFLCTVSRSGVVVLSTRQAPSSISSLRRQKVGRTIH